MKIQRMENMTTEIVFFSLWQSEQEVESSLQAIHTKNEKEKSLKHSCVLDKKLIPKMHILSQRKWKMAGIDLHNR